MNQKEKEEKEMRFSNDFCQTEYERLRSLYPDFSEISPPLINVSDVLKAYYALADFFTDPMSEHEESMLVGLRSIDLLCSALGRQTVGYCGKSKYTDPIDICSTLFFGMVKDHAFLDGNKRTALLILIYQLWKYNYYPTTSIRDFERLVVATAAGNFDSYPSYKLIWKKFEKEDDAEVKTISCILRKYTSKKNHSYHLTITMRKFADALSNHQVNCFPEGGKLHFERITPHKWYQKSETYKYAVTFGGWTRAIGPSTARDVLNNLKLYDQFPNYQSFIDGNEAFYSIIQEFEGPLRRLKDE